jgi:hypothetical protein
MRAGRRFHNRILAIAHLLLLVFLRPAAAESPIAQGPTEYQVKAAFLLNFTKFVQWPPSAFPDRNSPLSICVLGSDPFGSALDQILEGESVEGHKLTAKRVHAGFVSNCQALFVSSSEKDIPDILASLGPGVLTIGDGESFIPEGGVIGFVLDHRRVRFDINTRAANRELLKLSSKLLSVARSVSN